MNTYIAFDLYRRNEQGGHQNVFKLKDGKQVYLATDVDELKQALRRCIDAIEYTYGRCYGLPSQLIEARDAAKDLLASVTK